MEQQIIQGGRRKQRAARIVQSLRFISAITAPYTIARVHSHKNTQTNTKRSKHKHTSTHTHTSTQTNTITTTQPHTHHTVTQNTNTNPHPQRQVDKDVSGLRLGIRGRRSGSCECVHRNNTVHAAFSIRRARTYLQHCRICSKPDSDRLGEQPLPLHPRAGLAWTGGALVTGSR